MFAIVDVETTGGHAAQHGITEIAIVRHDGQKVVDHYHTLLNPQRLIPAKITALTGIDQSMVTAAPSFAEKAAEIAQWLEGAVFVAHNVNFDYSFVRSAFAGCGQTWQASRLCTVRYARALVPGLASYGLSSLCRHFVVRNEARHRALGDALATAEIFTMLQARDEQDIWRGMARRQGGTLNLPAHLPAAQYEALPAEPGVYYFLDQQQQPLYIGMAQNLKKRVDTHFGSKPQSKRNQQFKREIHGLRFRKTGSELLARLLEDHEIRHYRPRYNRAQNKRARRFALYSFCDQQGRWRMALNEVLHQQGYLKSFSSLSQGQAYCEAMATQYRLNPAYCGLYALREGLPSVSDEEHQAGFERFLADAGQNSGREIWPAAGRQAGEWGFVWLEEGCIKGIGFTERHPQSASEEELLHACIPLQNSPTIEAILQRRRDLDAQLDL